MEYVVGAALSLAIAISAAIVRLDRDRVFYPMLMAVIASYYDLFAVMGGSVQALVVESMAMAVFLGVALAGFKRNLWFVVVALACHGVFDLLHGHLISNPGVPRWWPMFCLAFDIVAAFCLGWRICRLDIVPESPDRSVRGIYRPRTNWAGRW